MDFFVEPGPYYLPVERSTIYTADPAMVGYGNVLSPATKYDMPCV